MVEMTANQLIIFSYVVMSLLLLSNVYAVLNISQPKVRKLAMSFMSIAAMCSMAYAAAS